MCFDQKIHGVLALTTDILSVLAAFSSEFSRPTWKNIQVLLIGAILCRGPRRISNVLRVMGLASVRNFSKYHRVLSRARWDGLILAKILLGLLIRLLPESWPILVAVDETLERRRGKKIKAKGLYRDAVQSSQSNVVTSYGLKWECMLRHAAVGESCSNGKTPLKPIVPSMVPYLTMRLRQRGGVKRQGQCSRAYSRVSTVRYKPNCQHWAVRS